jgi:hypothetical protein
LTFALQTPSRAGALTHNFQISKRKAKNVPFLSRYPTKEASNPKYLEKKRPAGINPLAALKLNFREIT